MKTKVIIFALLLISNFAIGQENYLWAIPGKQAGEGILYRPQDYIGVADAQSQAELNFGDLIIGAPLGTPVLCPVDGIYAYLAQKPFCTNLRKIVNKKGGFLCFGSCPIDDDQDVLYAGYEPLPNGEGFVKDEPEWRESDSLVNYKGRLYLLTNETSFSASTCFAGWVKKQNRGVIVGRETGSAYHQMWWVAIGVTAVGLVTGMIWKKKRL